MESASSRRRELLQGLGQTLLEETDSMEDAGSTRREFVQALGAGLLAAIAGSMTSSLSGADKPKVEVQDDAKYERMSKAAKEYMRQNMRENRDTARIYKEMLPQILEFAEHSGVEIDIEKCMDGRNHTNDPKCIPPTVATNFRSQGGKKDLGVGNSDYWKAMNKTRMHAASRKRSLLIMEMGHRSEIEGNGCAAFEEPENILNPRTTEEEVLAYQNKKALKLLFELPKIDVNHGKLAILSGMTNTDTGAMELYSNKKPIFHAEKIRQQEEIFEFSDVFDDKFVEKPIDEEWAHASIKGKTPGSLIDGHEAPFFTHMDVKIAFESYIMRLVHEYQESGDGPSKIFDAKVLKHIEPNLQEFNPELQRTLTYMMAMNIGYSTHFRNLNNHLKKVDAKAYETRVKHGEKKMAYSITGHDLESINSLLLIKAGSGNELETVHVGKVVLEKNLEKLGLADTLPPIVHINIEEPKPIETWEEYEEVVSRMWGKIRIIETEFGENVRIFTTYSYRQDVPMGDGGVCRVKQFFPLNALPANKKILIDPDEDIGRGMTLENFDKDVLRQRENEYTLQDVGKERVSDQKMSSTNVPSIMIAA